MSNLAFRAAVNLHASESVNGLFSLLAVGSPATLNSLQPQRVASPSRELQLRRGLVENAFAANQPSFDLTAPDLLWAMVPGTKIVRSRVELASEDRGTDSNVRGTEYEITITVQRALLDDWEANLYENDEMLSDQVKLLSRSGWRDVASITDITEDPAIEAEPTRIGNVHRYDLRLFATMVAA